MERTVAERDQSGTFQTIGVVEGFYGRVWKSGEREAFINGLAPLGLNTYLYAPKHEAGLGSALLEPLDKAARDNLKSLVGVCGNHRIVPMAGLHLEPPFEAAQSGHIEKLIRKAQELAEIGIQGFGVLFDDVPSGRSVFAGGGADPFGGSMAAAQSHAFNRLHQALEKQGAKAAWMICPGRYSLDPSLEEKSGTFEPDYLRRMHQETPPEVPWLWTGPRVCSSTVTPVDYWEYLSHVFSHTGGGSASRPLMLWDNYPVNDAHMQGRLHLDPVGGRSPELADHLQGYLFNPLLLPRLGLLPGATCLLYAKDPHGYDPTRAMEEALQRNFPPELHRPLMELAGLTRASETAGGLPPTWPRGSFPLSERLARAWNQINGGAPCEPYVVMDFRRVLDTLEKGLSPEIKAEAAPWQNRLRNALSLFESGISGAPMETIGPLRAKYVNPYIEGAIPEVLGPWFP